MVKCFPKIPYRTVEIKVLFVEAGLGGGSVNRMLNLLRHWNYARCQCGVFTFYNKKKAGELIDIPGPAIKKTLGVEEGSNTESVIKRKYGYVVTTFGLKYFFQSVKILLENKNAVIYLNNTLYSHLPLLFAAYIMKRRIICHLRDTISFTKMEKFFSAKINYFVALSNEARTHYINEGINSDKIKVIYDGIDLSSFETNCSNGNISKKVLNAVCIGSLCDRKGQDLCIKAFAEVKKSVPESRLLFVGNGPSESKLRSLVTKFSLEDSVTFLGYMDNIASVMQESHIGILASRREGLPNSVMEYMANGLPVIVSELPGIRELVIEGKSGYIFPQENHLILAKYWIQLLKDTQLRKVMGEAGLKSISDTRFSLQTEMKQIVNLISMVGQ